MFKKFLLAAAAGGAIVLAALTGAAGTAQAGNTSVHIGIGVPGVHIGPGYGHRERCWLPERHLCGPSYGSPGYGRPIYPGPVYYGGFWAPAFYFGAGYHPRFYQHARAPYHCHRSKHKGHAHKTCHRHW